MRNSEGFKTELLQDAWKVWEQKPLSKQYGSGFVGICSGSTESCPESNQVVPHQGWSTRENSTLLKGTPPYSCFEGVPKDKSRAYPPLACRERARKYPLHGWENLHHWRALQQPEQEDLCSNVPWSAFWGWREATILPMSWFRRRCPIRGWHLFIFARKGWNWCLRVSRGHATRSCETS